MLNITITRLGRLVYFVISVHVVSGLCYAVANMINIDVLFYENGENLTGIAAKFSELLPKIR